MKTHGKKAGFAACALALAALVSGVPAFAAGDGSMKHDGMKHGSGGGTPPPLDMLKMGDKAFDGKMGPWNAKARMMDMKAHMAMPAGMKMEGEMPNSHHLAIGLENAKTGAAVTEGTGVVTVTGPDKMSAKSDFMVMQGHFGADVNLPKPGKYTFKVEIASGKDKGGATFSYTVK